jgi:hypothetical protein
MKFMPDEHGVKPISTGCAIKPANAEQLHKVRNEKINKLHMLTAKEIGLFSVLILESRRVITDRVLSCGR